MSNEYNISISRISEESRIEKRTLTSRIHKRNIPYRYYGNKFMLKREDVFSLIKFNDEPLNYSDLKLDVSVLYTSGKTVEEISGYFNVNESLVLLYLMELKYTGCLVVESKINS